MKMCQVVQSYRRRRANTHEHYGTIPWNRLKMQVAHTHVLFKNALPASQGTQRKGNLHKRKWHCKTTQLARPSLRRKWH